eukprot:TRINITY_DN38683_c0_g1_i1.p1 TRINITY_DN38683_c0_g1~~TRINITY_DN38683_c0_g1_i1.p1  ORF type:complete len:1018 (-),score=198.07 TRINITY_DN38683_c0_g1_i1:22-3075(-)
MAPQASPASGARWLFELAAGSWQEWPRDGAQRLEEHYQRFQNGTGSWQVVLRSGPAEYMVDFQIMMQTNTRTQASRSLHREEDKTDLLEDTVLRLQSELRGSRAEAAEQRAAADEEATRLRRELGQCRAEETSQQLAAAREEASLREELAAAARVQGRLEEARARSEEASQQQANQEASAASAICGLGAVWLVEDDGGDWQPFGKQLNESVERAYANGDAEAYEYRGRTRMKFDFAAMVQTNTTTGRVRNLKRDAADYRPALSELEQQMEHLEHDRDAMSRSLLSETELGRELQAQVVQLESASLARLETGAEESVAAPWALNALRRGEEYQLEERAVAQECEEVRNAYEILQYQHRELEDDYENLQARHLSVQVQVQDDACKLRSLQCFVRLSQALKARVACLEHDSEAAGAAAEQQMEHRLKLVEEAGAASQAQMERRLDLSEAELQKERTNSEKVKDRLSGKTELMERLQRGMSAKESAIEHLKKELAASEASRKKDGTALITAKNELMSTTQQYEALESEHKELQVQLRRAETEAKKRKTETIQRNAQNTLTRLQKSLGIDAPEESTKEQSEALRRALVSQVEPKGFPCHWREIGAQIKENDLAIKRVEEETADLDAELAKLKQQRHELAQKKVRADRTLALSKEQQVRSVTLRSPIGYKVDLCAFYDQDTCAKGAACPFAHGKADLRHASTVTAKASVKEVEEAKIVVKQFEDMKTCISRLEDERRQLLSQVAGLGGSGGYAEYREAMKANDTLTELLRQEEFATRLLSSSIPAKKDEKEVDPSDQLFTFVTCVIQRSLTKHRLTHGSDERCSLAQYDIISVTRVMNPELSHRYKYEFLKLKTKHPKGVRLPDGLHALELDSSVGELVLFHGCRADAVPNILQQGFDFRLSGTSAGTMFGKGSYFAENASKSDLYSKPDHNGVRSMLLAKVLIGNTQVATSGRSDLCRPEVDPCTTAGDGLYDSVMGERRDLGGSVDFREFITFHQNRAVPVALIKYRHRPSCRCNLCTRGW